MGGERVPGPLGMAKSDEGTPNRQRSSAPGVTGVLRHRYHQPWELRANRRLFNADPTRISEAERYLWDHPGHEPFFESLVLGGAEANVWFEGFSLATRSPILLLPNPNFHATPWERAFGLTFLSRHPKSSPIVNASNEVVGHIAYFRNYELLVPAEFAGEHLGDVVASGMPAFVRTASPDPRAWDMPHVQTGYHVVVTPGGEVLAVLGSRDLDGAGSQSTLGYILDVLLLIEGYYLVRAAASAAARAAMSRLDGWLAKRAQAALERERVKALGLARTQPPEAFARTQSARPEAFARTQPAEAMADTVPGSPNITLNTGDFAGAKVESELLKRINAMHRETGAELDMARAARQSSAPDAVFDAGGTDWMDEVVQIMDRVRRKHFPEGLYLD